jgi:hypothetical protein
VHERGARRIDNVHALAQGLDEGDCRRGVCRRSSRHGGGVEATTKCHLGDRPRCRRWNHAGRGSPARQGALELEHRRDDAVVGKNRGERIRRGEAVDEAHGD